MGLGAMGRKSLIVGALAVLLGIGSSGAVLASFTGPGPWITGNDTGGIIPYSPDLEGVYQQMAAGLLRALAAGCRTSHRCIAPTAITSASSASTSRG